MQQQRAEEQRSRGERGHRSRKQAEVRGAETQVSSQHPPPAHVYREPHGSFPGLVDR